jgi:hypothetical protein
MTFKQSAKCACHKSKITVHSKPFARFMCHCTICQNLYKKPYADFVVVNAKHVQQEKGDHLEYAKYRLPPALNRGICSECHAPLLGKLRIAPFVQLAFIPSDRFEDPNQLPEPQGHIFYHSRAKDIEDDLPKISGYWKSELAVTSAVIKGMI